MITQLNLAIRPALPSDRQRVASLIHFEGHTHRHLDWRPPLDWFGYQPFLLAEQQGQLVGALACPPDPADVGWVRLFASGMHLPIQAVWQALWTALLQQIAEIHTINRIATLPLSHWFEDLLVKSNFSVTHAVVMLNIELPRLTFVSQPAPDGVNLRLMSLDDLPAVQVVDEAAFQPIWRNSLPSLEIAFGQSDIATVAERDGKIIGYQISTGTAVGGHLARLAVHPTQQGRRIGKSLLLDMLSRYKRRGITRVTVNTQQNNPGSLILYQKAGFILTGEEYPVYEFIP